MKARSASRLAWSLWALQVGALAVVTAYGVAHPETVTAGRGSAAIEVTFPLFVVAFATVGALVASRRPSNPIGWLLCASGLCYAIAGSSEIVRHVWEPARRILSAMGWIWGLGIGLVIFVILLFPDGKLPSRRWRPVAWVTAIALAAAVIGSTFAPTIPDSTQPNPLGFGGAAGRIFTLLSNGFALVIVSALAAIASLVVRNRRADRTERQQLKWLLYAGGLVAMAILAQVVISLTLGSTAFAVNLENAIVTGAVAFVPVAIGIAILKHGLYDIDVVINKTVVFGALAAFITGVYVAIVVGIGALFGRGDKPNVALSIAATAVVAIAFQPVRERVQRFANRIVYGKRATPYEVMSDFSHRMAGSLSVDSVLPQMAEAAAKGVGAAAARVRIFLPTGGEESVTWPEGEPAADTFDRSLEVLHASEAVGEIAVAKPRGEPLTPAEEKLLSDLAGQAGLALHNVRLALELQARLDQISEQAQEIETSRRRIVAARDAALRQLERDIEGGAQRQLLDIGAKLRVAADDVEAEPKKAAALLDELSEETNEALETMRDLARGIFPPLLADKGLVAAIEAHINKHGLPAKLEANGIGRYDPGIEAAIFFCCIEAMGNTKRFAPNASITVKLSTTDGALSFNIIDDGPGFKPAQVSTRPGITNMSDRVEAVGGTFEIRSQPGEGTIVAGRIPMREMEPAS